MRAGAEGEHGDDSGDADDDAEGGEAGAEFVEEEGAAGLLEVNPEFAREFGQWGLGDFGVVEGYGAGFERAGKRRGGAGFVGFDLTVFDVDDAAGVFGDFGFVGDDDDGDAGAVEFLEEFHDLATAVGIEVAGGFIGHEDGGIVDEGAGDGDALLLAAGEFVGAVVEALAEADLFEEFLRAGGFVVDFVAVDEWEGDVVDGGGAAQEVELLEDEADGFGADVGELVVVEPGDVFVEELEGAGVGLVEEAEEVEEGRFAGAGLAHDGDEFTGFNVQGDATQGLDDHVAHGIAFGDVAKFDHGGKRRGKYDVLCFRCQVFAFDT